MFRFDQKLDETCVGNIIKTNVSSDICVWFEPTLRSNLLGSITQRISKPAFFFSFRLTQRDSKPKRPRWFRVVSRSKLKRRDTQAAVKSRRRRVASTPAMVHAQRISNSEVAHTRGTAISRLIQASPGKWDSHSKPRYHSNRGEAADNMVLFVCRSGVCCC